MTVRIAKGQAGRIHRLAEKECANCLHGNCLLLDDGNGHRCVQLISKYGIYCTYFLNTVLPVDKELYEEIMKQNQTFRTDGKKGKQHEKL